MELVPVVPLQLPVPLSSVVFYVVDAFSVDSEVVLAADDVVYPILLDSTGAFSS